MGRGGAQVLVPQPPLQPQPRSPRSVKSPRPGGGGSSAAHGIRTVLAVAEQLHKARIGRCALALVGAHAAAADWWENEAPNRRLSARIAKVEREIAALETSGRDADSAAAQPSPPSQPQQLQRQSSRGLGPARRMLGALQLSKRQMESDHRERHADAVKRQRQLEERELQLLQHNTARMRDAGTFDLARLVLTERAGLFELWTWLTEGHAPAVFIGALQGSTVAIDALAVEFQIWHLGLMDLPAAAHGAGAPMARSCLETAWPSFDAMEHDLKQWKVANEKVVRARKANLSSRSLRRSLGLGPSAEEQKESKAMASEKQLLEDEMDKLRQRIKRMEDEKSELLQEKDEAHRAKSLSSGLADLVMVKQKAAHTHGRLHKQAHKHRMQQVLAEALPSVRDLSKICSPLHTEYSVCMPRKAFVFVYQMIRTGTMLAG